MEMLAWNCFTNHQSSSIVGGIDQYARIVEGKKKRKTKKRKELVSLFILKCAECDFYSDTYKSRFTENAFDIKYWSISSGCEPSEKVILVWKY